MNPTKDMRDESNLQSRRSVMVWSLHWVSALLTVYLVATSLGSGLGISKRIFPTIWMDWHLSAGTALVIITVVRMYTSTSWKGLRNSALKTIDGIATRFVLLLTVLATTMTGLVIYQKPPFGRIGFLFGLFPMPTLIRLRHSYHNLIIELHIVLAIGVTILLLSHVCRDRSRIVYMLWPWRQSK